jgi:hypothetical protein
VIVAACWTTGCADAGSPAAAEREPAAVVPVPVPIAVGAPTEPKPSAATPAPAAPATATKSTKPEKKSDGKELKVSRLVVAKGIERSTREPVNVGTTFKKGEYDKIYAYLEVDNPGDASKVVVAFDPPSDKPDKGLVTLDVGRSPKWRTWAFSRTLDEPGTWTAIVKTTDGRELARTEFEVVL